MDQTRVEAVVDGAPDQVSYAPDANYCNSQPGGAPDTFTYTVDDGTGRTDTATVAVTVTCVNDDPIANDDGPLTVAEDSTANEFDVAANDTDAENDPIQIVSAGNPVHGTTTVIEGTTDKVAYTPNANYCGTDSFLYQLAGGGGDTATVSVNVTCSPDAPIANDDSPNAISEDANATAIDVLANDTDADSDPITITGADATGSHGSVVVTGGGTGLTYQPEANYCNTQPGGSPATFTYTVKRRRHRDRLGHRHLRRRCR